MMSKYSWNHFRKASGLMRSKEGRTRLRRIVWSKSAPQKGRNVLLGPGKPSEIEVSWSGKEPVLIYAETPEFERLERGLSGLRVCRVSLSAGLSIGAANLHQVSQLFANRQPHTWRRVTQTGWFIDCKIDHLAPLYLAKGLRYRTIGVLPTDRIFRVDLLEHFDVLVSSETWEEFLSLDIGRPPIFATTNDPVAHIPSLLKNLRQTSAISHGRDPMLWSDYEGLSESNRKLLDAGPAMFVIHFTDSPVCAQSNNPCFRPFLESITIVGLRSSVQQQYAFLVDERLRIGSEDTKVRLLEFLFSRGLPYERINNSLT